MSDIQNKVVDLVNGLYPNAIIDETARLAGHYLDSQDRSRYTPIPSSLHQITDARRMADVNIEGPDKKFRTGLFSLLGFYDGQTIKGSLNHILARMITIPRMIVSYVENYPSEKELNIYTDPPFLQFRPEELKGLYKNYFEKAAEKLNDHNELLSRFKILGDIGEEVACAEMVYPAANSTQAYELFGIFHLFPSNRTVDITSTSPGIILPTEADPLRFRDSVPILTKNLLRPTYFEMLRYSIDIGNGRQRRYSASRKGTTQNLAEYPQLVDEAKHILERYLDLGDKFEIRIGEQNDKTKLATLIGDIGVVYSVRDPEQKDKIAHNVTVINPDEAKRLRGEFESQWTSGTPIRNTSVVDDLIGK